MDDTTDLRLWLEHRDEPAFARIVGRHGGMVRAACQRQLGSGQEADDALQAVFIVLARRADDISRPEQLGAWLCGTARKVCLNARRAQLRRTHHEHLAVAAAPAAMNDLPADDPGWDRIRPHLDEALAGLDADRRVAVVSHFFQGRTHAEIAARMGITENAVQKRIVSSLEHLRRWFGRRGLAVSVLALGVGLAHEASALDPVLIPSVATTALHPPASGPAVALAGSVAGGGLSMAVVALVAAGAIAIGGTGAWILADHGRAVPADATATHEQAISAPGATAATTAGSSSAPTAARVIPRLFAHGLEGWAIERGTWSVENGVVVGLAGHDRGARISHPRGAVAPGFRWRMRITGGTAGQAEVQFGGYRSFAILPATGAWQLLEVAIGEAGGPRCRLDGNGLPLETGTPEEDGQERGQEVAVYVSGDGRVEIAEE